MRKLLEAAAAAAFVLAGSRAEAAASYLLHDMAMDYSEGYGISAAPLVAGTDGNFYGVAAEGVFTATTQAGGTVFKMTPTGTLTVLHVLDEAPVNGPYINAEGVFPCGLVRAGDGAFYGSAIRGGANGSGTVFRVTEEGVFTVLYTFSASASDGTNVGGIWPETILVGADGALYGTTASGGTSGKGTFFKLTFDGNLTTLYNFSNDYSPLQNLLIAGDDGNFYGASGNTYGGFGNTVFKLTATGGYSVVHQLAASEGQFVTAMTAGRDGYLYVATVIDGGFSQVGVSLGSVLRLTTSGNVTVLHQFAPEVYRYDWSGCWGDNPCKWLPYPLGINADGGSVETLLQAAGGTLYGSMTNLGPDGGGGIFSLTQDGVFTLLNSNGGLAPYSSAGTLTDAGDGGYILTVESRSGLYPESIVKLVPNAPLSVHAAFTPSTVRLFGTAKLSWSSTGASSCTITGDYADSMKDVTATSGSRSVRVWSIQRRKPATFFAVVNCKSADGLGVANAVAPLAVQ